MAAMDTVVLCTQARSGVLRELTERGGTQAGVLSPNTLLMESVLLLLVVRAAGTRPPMTDTTPTQGSSAWAKLVVMSLLRRLCPVV